MLCASKTAVKEFVQKDQPGGGRTVVAGTCLAY